MTFSHPWWLPALLLWALVPLLDRLAKPRPSASLPLPHLGMRALYRQTTSLPWLSGHGLAIMLIVLALAGPVWWRSVAVTAEPGIAVVAVPGPGSDGWRAGGRQFDALIERLRQRSALLITAGSDVPRLLVPWTERSDALKGLWPASPAPVSGADAAKAALMAGAKAPSGAWVVVVGGVPAGPGWRAVGAAVKERHQSLVLITESPEQTVVEPAFRASLYDPDAVAALDYQLLTVTRDGAGGREPLPLARWCLAAAVVMLIVNWGWRHGRWRVVAP